jgi:hypothetical protein
VPEGCFDAKQKEAERQEAERKEKEVRAAAEACQRQEAKPMQQSLGHQPVGCEIAGLPVD